MLQEFQFWVGNEKNHCKTHCKRLLISVQAHTEYEAVQRVYKEARVFTWYYLEVLPYMRLAYVKAYPVPTPITN